MRRGSRRSGGADADRDGRAVRGPGGPGSAAACVAVLLLLVTAPGAAPAQEATAATRAAPSDSLRARVDRVFRDFGPETPGCALAVIRGDRVLYERGYGMADLEEGRPIRPGTRFYAASVSKQFTAASVLLAEGQGALSADDPVREHVPELPRYGDTIRIRHLAHHTSGIRDMYGLMDLAGLGLEAASAGDVVELIARQDSLNFAPGTDRLYSNAGYLLMAEIVGRATGGSLRTFADEHLFGPLGMSDTHFHDDALHPIPRKAVGYERDDDGEGVERAYLPGFTGVGPGGMWTTVRDLARWNGQWAAPVVGGPGFLERMTERAVLRGGDTLDYAWGVDLSPYKGLRTVGHGGSFMGYRTHFLRFPEQSLAVACLCNRRDIDPGDRVREVADLWLEGEIRGRLSPYAGRYRSDEVGSTWAVFLDDADLVAKGPDGERRPLTYEEPGVFGMGGADLRFEREDGRVTGFTYEGGRVRGVRFVKVEGE